MMREHDARGEKIHEWLPDSVFWHTAIEMYSCRGAIMLSVGTAKFVYGNGHYDDPWPRVALEDSADWKVDKPFQHGSGPAWTDLYIPPRRANDSPRSFAGFSWRFDRRDEGEVLFPYWFVVLIALPYPLWRLRRAWVNHMRPKPGRCDQCGYDLRATPCR